jgi:hypothetical protein
MSYVFDEYVDRCLDVLVGLEGVVMQELSKENPDQLLIEQAVNLWKLIRNKTDEEDDFFKKDREILIAQLNKLSDYEVAKELEMDTDLVTAISNIVLHLRGIKIDEQKSEEGLKKVLQLMEEARNKNNQ